MKGSLFIISSTSGGGKGTLIDGLLAAVPDIELSVSYTTRRKRQGETDGREYHFVTADQFEELVRQGEFLEHAVVHSHRYGTSRKQVESATVRGMDILLEVDVQGADEVRRKVPDAVSIFVLPPSFETLSERLRKRGTEGEAELETRLTNARREIRRCFDFDFCVVNDDLERAISDLKKIVLGERLRTDRQLDRIHDILSTFEPL